MARLIDLPKLDTVPEWQDIEFKLQMSTPLSEVALYIKSNVKEYKKEEIKTIELMLGKAIRSSKNLSSIYIPMSHTFLLRSCADQKVEPHQFYQILAAIQFDRVMRGYNKEMETGIHDPKLNDSVKTMNDILHNMASLKILAQNRPDQSSALLDTVKAEYLKRYGPKMADLAVNPDSRKRVVNFLQIVKASFSDSVSKSLDEREPVVIEHKDTANE